jgi:hypothetical protein
MPPHRRPRLGSTFGPLEDRLAPAQFGLPWPNANLLTVSFPADGVATPVGGNEAAGKLGATAPGWQREVLRAFQTWAVNTPLNIGVVADGGQPLGAPGAVQGDRRFGDVRVAAGNIAGTTELAFASPFTWSGTTFAGDVLFDTGNAFAVGNVAGKGDVFTVAAHEAGHALGLDHSDEAGSVLNPTYTFRTGLGGDDVARIQALYGPRLPDAHEGDQGNGTVARATTLSLATTSNTTSRFQATADLTTAGDVDVYKLTVPHTVRSAVGRLKASGESLLLARVTLLDAAGNALNAVTATDPLSNDLTFTSGPITGGDYFVRVEAATADVFGRGGYRLVADLSTGDAPPSSPLPAAVTHVLDLLTNETRGTATTLTTRANADERFDAAFHGTIESALDADFYRVESPRGDGSGRLNLNVLVWGSEVNPVLPAVRVFDNRGNPLGVTVLGNDNGTVSVRASGLTTNRTYFVQVTARAPGSVGGYTLGADFNLQAVTAVPGVAAGTLSGSAVHSNTLTVAQSGVYQVGLNATAVPGAGTALTGGVAAFDLVAADGAVFTSLAAEVGRVATRSIYLPVGTYTVRFRGQGNLVGGLLGGSVRYGLHVNPLSDPIGPEPTDVTGGDPPPPDEPYTYHGSSDTPPSDLPVMW